MSAQSFLIRAIEGNGVPEIINIDKSGSNTHAIRVCNKRCYTSIEIRECKYLNNIIEQDHRHIKYRLKLGLGFKEFESAKRTIGGIEVIQMIKKNQVKNPMSTNYRTFCSLVG
jgi:putative transposase